MLVNSPVRKAQALPGRAGRERTVAGIVAGAYQILRDGIENERTRQMVEGRSADGFLQSLPWDRFMAALGETVQPMQANIRKAVKQEQGRIPVAKAEWTGNVTAGPAPAATIRAGIGFDHIDEVSAHYAQTQSAQLIRNITDSQRATIQGILGRALNGEYTVDQAARQIREGIGLHPAWAQAVQNYRARLEGQAAPKGYSANRWSRTIDGRTERYQQRLIRTRAQTIARTEIMTSENLGRYASFEAAVQSGQAATDSRKEWSAGPGACPICADLAGQVVRWDQAFDNGALMPPAHPNCRCGAVMLPPEYGNTALNPRNINWTNPAGDHATERTVGDDAAGNDLLDTAPAAVAGADPGSDGGADDGGDTAEPLSAYERDLQAMHNMAVPTQADRLTYDNTLHWSDDKLMDAIGKYADDPEAVDKILAIIDQREEAAAAREAGNARLQEILSKPTLKEDTNPVTNPAVRPARKLSPGERASEEYHAYVQAQYAHAEEETNGVFIKRALQGEADRKGIDSFSLFTGPIQVARKYASEELLQFWEDYGRQTLASFRYQMLKRPGDRWAYEHVLQQGMMGGGRK